MRRHHLDLLNDHVTLIRSITVHTHIATKHMALVQNHRLIFIIHGFVNIKLSNNSWAMLYVCIHTYGNTPYTKRDNPWSIESIQKNLLVFGLNTCRRFWMVWISGLPLYHPNTQPHTTWFMLCEHTPSHTRLRSCCAIIRWMYFQSANSSSWNSAENCPRITYLSVQGAMPEIMGRTF